MEPPARLQRAARTPARPWAVVDEETILIGFQRQGRIYLFLSADGGKSLIDLSPLGEPDLGPGGFCHLAGAGPDRVAVTWEHTRDKCKADRHKKLGIGLGFPWYYGPRRVTRGKPGVLFPTPVISDSEVDTFFVKKDARTRRSTLYHWHGDLR